MDFAGAFSDNFSSIHPWLLVGLGYAVSGLGAS